MQDPSGNGDVTGRKLYSGPSHLQKNLEPNGWRRVELRARNYKLRGSAVMRNSAVVGLVLRKLLVLETEVRVLS